MLVPSLVASLKKPKPPTTLTDIQPPLCAMACATASFAPERIKVPSSPARADAGNAGSSQRGVQPHLENRLPSCPPAWCGGRTKMRAGGRKPRARHDHWPKPNAASGQGAHQWRSPSSSPERAAWVCAANEPATRIRTQRGGAGGGWSLSAGGSFDAARQVTTITPVERRRSPCLVRRCVRRSMRMALMVCE